MYFDFNKPLKDQIGAQLYHHEEDECDCCDEPCDCWVTLQYDGENYYWYSMWQCRNTLNVVFDVHDPIEKLTPDLEEVKDKT